jgi:hypothetical protein
MIPLTLFQRSPSYHGCILLGLFLAFRRLATESHPGELHSGDKGRQVPWSLSFNGVDRELNPGLLSRFLKNVLANTSLILEENDDGRHDFLFIERCLERASHVRRGGIHTRICVVRDWLGPVVLDRT